MAPCCIRPRPTRRSSFATCARLIGPEVKLTIEQTLPGNLSMEDWTIMREIIASERKHHIVSMAYGRPPDVTKTTNARFWPAVILSCVPSAVASIPLERCGPY